MGQKARLWRYQCIFYKEKLKLIKSDLKKKCRSTPTLRHKYYPLTLLSWTTRSPTSNESWNSGKSKFWVFFKIWFLGLYYSWPLLFHTHTHFPSSPISFPSKSECGIVGYYDYHRLIMMKILFFTRLRRFQSPYLDFQTRKMTENIANGR